MKQRFKKKAILILIFMSFFGITNHANPIPIGLSYWSPGNQDCLSAHGVSNITAYYNRSPSIILNGIGDEDAWLAVNETVVPTATISSSSTFFKSYIRIKILYDDENLYVLTRWNDSTPLNLQDAISICWNINVANYTVAMFLEPDLMKTMNENESVDTWKWSYFPAENGSTYKTKDQSFGVNGWRDFKNETQDVDSAFTYGTDSNGVSYYQVEFKRVLITRDDMGKDVQFNRNGEYYTSFAILDNLGGHDHAVSWTWRVIFDNLEKSNLMSAYPPALIISSVLLGIIAIIKRGKRYEYIQQ